MFNQYLAKGCVVLDIDYRGSAGYGRDGVDLSGMGGRDLQNNVDGSHYLRRARIDPERINMVAAAGS
jgi:dipeptidyl aminopeptidase/acylaminoacyl peptidase